jgi:hypothetical protein
MSQATQQGDSALTADRGIDASGGRWAAEGERWKGALPRIGLARSPSGWGGRERVGPPWEGSNTCAAAGGNDS